MSIEIRVPVLGESVQEATLASWHVKAGDSVTRDTPIAELDTDKVSMEVVAPDDGVIDALLVEEGANVGIDDLLATMVAGAAKPASQTAEKPETREKLKTEANQVPEGGLANGPAVNRLAAENNIDAAGMSGTGKDGRVTKGDMLDAIAGSVSQPVSEPNPTVNLPQTGGEERVKMTKLRQTIARRLKEAQNTAAMLTTFNEIDMTEILTLRNAYKDLFQKKHGVKLGFMSFFVKAVIQALKEIPAVNAEIDGADIVYKNYYHIGVAVGSPRGLVVPVVKHADHLSFSGIEKQIGDYGLKARDGNLAIADMQGGTFTISNGGIYGSLMSTPILNAPQSGILGMHKIQERPVVVNGEVKVRPMMYLALSYDHRIVDGKEAVTFLVRIKEGLEDPARLVLDL